MDLFEQSFLMMDELNRELENSKLMDGVIRLDLVYQCCYISMEHSVAVKSLLKAKLYTSALALFRIQFESVVRAYWVLLRASNDQILKMQTLNVNELFKNEKMPMVSEMIEQLKNIEEIKAIALQFEEFKFYSLKHLNSIVHTGKHSIIRNSVGLTQKQSLDVIKQSNGLVSRVAQILLCHAGKEKYIHYIHPKYRDCFQMHDDITLEEKQSIDARYKS